MLARALFGGTRATAALVRMASTTPGVHHDAAACTFSIEVPGGHGILAYTRAAGVVDIVSTRVPAAARGLGTAKTLSDAAFALARAESATVRPSCSYIRDTYLAKGADGKPFWFDEAAGIVRFTDGAATTSTQ